MTIEAKVILHSRPSWAENDKSDIYTLQLKYPRFIHSEFMTHRVFSRSASSSRAVPVKRIITAVQSDPYMPKFASNKPGMQAGEEFSAVVQGEASHYWDRAMQEAIDAAFGLADLGVHKQWVNRLLEPWSHISVVVTSTEWDNFFRLRDHPDAQPEMQQLAAIMRGVMVRSTPQILEPDQWHIPYINPTEAYVLTTEKSLSVSPARCARVSYLKHDSTNPSMEEDFALTQDLLTAKHMSPFEHQAICWDLRRNWRILPGVTHITYTNWGAVDPWSANFRNWGQHRQILSSSTQQASCTQTKSS